MERRRNTNASRLFALLFLAAFVVIPAPLRAETSPSTDSIEPGVYVGTFVFTVEHGYYRSTQDMPENFYMLFGESELGSIRFRVAEDGQVPGVSLRVPAFSYWARSSQVINVPKDSQGEYNCTGNRSRAAGMGTVSGGSGATTAPPLVPGFRTTPAKFNAGDPWGLVNMIGYCPGKPDSGKFVEAVKSDINSLASNPWSFSIEWQGFASVGGSCSHASWTTVDRSISCFWAAYSNGYKRMTEPGPGR